ncbi:MAG: translesion error-prone DNA polymerase V autoproteolytic subunit [Prevotellaceae bacterium]|nr:translesion error-prone DNA polymerase V autoproteolytic subunit [Prevotellaceae bacterium]
MELFRNEQDRELKLPFADLGVSAGFPSPAQDYIQLSIDLNRELIKNPASTFLARVKGLSMKDAGIDDGDILIIDKSLQPLNGDIVVSYINGEFTLKTFKKEKDGIYLMPANQDYKPIKINPGDNFMIWGVVTYSIRDERVKRKYR